jgi:hypothetical protein
MTPLSLTGKRWVVRETSADGISIPEMLLARRKIGALGQGEIIEGVIGYDAHGFNDFEKAAARIEKAIKDEELIGIFGDYDCDGITATAIMGRFLKRHGNAPIMRLPHRQKEGYGLRKKTMDDFKESGVTLLITVDTGVTALEPITHANELGIDVIVLDHHHLPEILPPAFVILHQGLASPAPDAAPCAAGIAWSAVQAMEKNTWDDRETDIALAAIGTVADIVELRGENRSLTHAGLMALAQLRPERPLSMLCAHAGLESPYTSRDIGCLRLTSVGLRGGGVHAGDEPALGGHLLQRVRESRNGVRHPDGEQRLSHVRRECRVRDPPGRAHEDLVGVLAARHFVQLVLPPEDRDFLRSHVGVDRPHYGLVRKLGHRLRGEWTGRQGQLRADWRRHRAAHVDVTAHRQAVPRYVTQCRPPAAVRPLPPRLVVQADVGLRQGAGPGGEQLLVDVVQTGNRVPGWGLYRPLGHVHRGRPEGG